MPDFMCEAIESGACSTDGETIVLHASTGDAEPLRIGLPAVEVPRTVALLFSLLRDAYACSGRKGLMPSIALVEARIIRSESKPGKVLIEAVLLSGAPGLVLEVAEEPLLDLARGILEAAGQIAPDRTGGGLTQ